MANTNYLTFISDCVDMQFQTCVIITIIINTAIRGVYETAIYSFVNISLQSAADEEIHGHVSREKYYGISFTCSRRFLHVDRVW